MTFQLSNIKIISVDGIIGAGKTTLLINIAKYSKYKNIIHVLPEPIDLWKDVRYSIYKENIVKNNNNFNILKYMYQNPKRWAYTMQIWALYTRSLSLLNYILMIKKMNKNKQKIIILMERSLMSNNIFSSLMKENNSINEMEWIMYLKIYNFFNKKLPSLDGIIFLNTSISISMNRIKKRNRLGESNITYYYQEQLIKKHIKMIEDLKLEKRIKVLEINGNIKLKQEELYIQNIVKNLDNFITDIIQLKSKI